MPDPTFAARHALRVWLDQPHRRLQLQGQVLAPWWRWRFASFGRGSVLGPPRWLAGGRGIAIGDGCFLHPGLWLAVERQALDQQAPAMVLGNRVAIRGPATLSCAESVVLEDDVVLGGGVTIVDSDHRWHPRPRVVDNPLTTSPVRIGRGTWVADGSVVLRGADIGARCVVGAGSVVRGRIPDGSIVVGAPARVVGSTDAIRTT